MKVSPHRYSAKVVKHAWLGPNLLSIEFAKPDGDCTWLPGQFVSLAVGDSRRRSYSLASSLQDVYWRIYVDTKPQGPGSVYLSGLKVGDELDVLGPLGRFIYRESNTPVYFFATGVGIAPFLPMLRYELQNVRSGRQTVLCYGAATAGELLEVGDLERMAAESENFQLRLYVSKDDQWSGRKGRITQEITAQIPFDAEVYICGGHDMVTDVRQRLQDLGKSDDKIFYEQFY